MMMKTYNKPRIDYIIKITSKDLQSKLVIKYSGTEIGKDHRLLLIKTQETEGE